MAMTSSAPGRLAWRLRRLGSMSAPEVAWRCSRIAADRLPGTAAPWEGRELVRGGDAGWAEALDGFRSGAGRPVLLDRATAAAIARAHPDQVDELVRAAEGVLAGRVSFFGHGEVTLSRPVDWHHDLVSGHHWPQASSRRIDHRVGGDPKWIWELNRLQHLPWLAEAWLHTGRDELAEEALRSLDSWIVANPPGQGIAWQNAFEVGIRSISIGVALQGLRDSPALTPERFRRVVGLLAASADDCWRRRSRYSSANNHLVGELAGIAVVALLLPELRSSRRLLDESLSLLALEATRQVLPDGAGAEQAIGYQVFTSELMLVVATLLRAAGRTPPEEVVAAVDRSARYLAVLVGEHDPEPRYGDDDEGFALRLDPSPLRTVRDHLAVVGAATGDPLLRARGTDGLTAAWIGAVSRPEDAVEDRRQHADPPPDLFAPDGGLVVLRAGGRRVTMDVGPLGYLSIAAHGHADALAVGLSVDGQDLVGDPGAASYYVHPEWRRAHRSTAAHATVTVDGQDQSVSGGPFLWTRHARVTVRHVDLARGLVEAEHDGYRRLSEPVGHRRWLLASPEQRAVLVVDLLEGAGEHDVRVSWPLHPSLEVTPTASGHVVTRGSEPVLQIASAATAAVETQGLRGDVSSNLGWWSERLEAREPAWLLRAGTTCRTPVVAATVLRPLTDGTAAGGADGAAWPVTDLWVGRNHSVIDVGWSDRGRTHAVTIDTSRPGNVRHTVA